MNLFPYALVRLGGEPFDLLQDLDMDSSQDWDLEAAQDRLKAVRSDLCDQLFEAGGQTEDESERRAVINLKRDLFNQRDPDPAGFELLQRLDPDGAAQLQDLTEQAANEGTRHRERYAAAQAQSRSRLRQAVRGEVTARGMTLASRVLSEKRVAYAEGQGLGKREQKVELSLLKYFSRISAKTSPFSTFTPLTMAHADVHTDHPDTPPTLFPTTSTPPQIKSEVRLNNLLFKYLHDLLSLHPDYLNFFHVRINPTLKRLDDHFLFLINIDNLESFQRLPLDPVLDLFTSLLGPHAAGLEVRELRAQLAEAVDADPEDLNAYIRQLIDFGFLEVDLGVSCIDTNWDLELRGFLSGLEPKPYGAQALWEALGRLRRMAEAFAEADADMRPRRLQEAAGAFRAICRRLHQDARLPASDWEPDPPKPKAQSAAETASDQAFQRRITTRLHLKPEFMFYEDCTADKPVRVDGTALQTLLNLWRGLTQLPICPSGHERERARMTAWFKRNFKGPVDLTTFYEAYYRQVKTAETPPQFPEVDAVTARYEAAKNALHQHLADCRPDENDVVHLSLAQLIKASVGLQADPAPRSSACFLQGYTHHDGRIAAVINQGSSGFGRMFSRFLHLFDPKITGALREHNQAAFPDALTAENSDASVFNANLHPALAPFEIQAPGGWNNLPPKDRISIVDIQVALADGRLRAVRAVDGKPIEVLNLGFQSDTARSELFLLLNTLGPDDYRDIYLLRDVVNQVAGERKGPFTFRPRIMLEHRLVLQRRAWLFEKKAVPTRGGNEPWADYRFRLHTWAKSYGMPHHLFVSVATRADVRAGAKAGQASSDDYKPQYMSFQNPLLIPLFDKLVAKAPNAVKLEEMLPSPDQLITLCGKRYVHEMVIQGYT